MSTIYWPNVIPRYIGSSSTHVTHVEAVIWSPINRNLQLSINNWQATGKTHPEYIHSGKTIAAFIYVLTTFLHTFQITNKEWIKRLLIKSLNHKAIYQIWRLIQCRRLILRNGYLDFCSKIVILFAKNLKHLQMSRWKPYFICSLAQNWLPTQNEHCINFRNHSQNNKAQQKHSGKVTISLTPAYIVPLENVS